MKTTVSIPGIHCEGCSRLIADVSNDVAGVTGVSVDLAAKTVAIEHDDRFDLAAWSKEIEALNPSYVVHPAS